MKIIPQWLRARLSRGRKADRRGNDAVAPFLRADGLPDWAAILASEPDLWQAALRRAEIGPRVLIATNVGGHGPVSVVESMLAVALTLRGAKVHTLLCDHALPGCMRAQLDANIKPEQLASGDMQALCGYCFKRGSQVFEPLGLSHHRLSDLLTTEERAEANAIARSVPAAEMRSFRWDGMAVGEHALAGALRYYARGTLETGDALAETIAARYLEAAILTAFATRRLIDVEQIAHSVFHHGIYIPQGVVGEVCRQRCVHVSNWVVAYRRNTLIFSHDDSYHHTLMDEPVSQWKQMSWGMQQETQVMSYLRSRWGGERDWIYFHEKPDEDFAKFAERYRLDPNKKIIGLLTNVFWDAQLHFKQNAFANMLDWLLKTIDWFRRRPELQLVIRIHPAEIRGTVKSRQKLLDELRATVPDMPANVFVVPPEDSVSTYAVLQHCDSAIIYGTKMGVELTSQGMPVIVAGEAWIRNKGLTYDASSEGEYYALLEQLPFGARLPADTIRDARKYAYHFFFRRMLPVPFIDSMDRAPNFCLRIDSLADLLPGRHPGLDVICDGIIDPERPFVFEAERIGLHDAA